MMLVRYLVTTSGLLGKCVSIYHEAHSLFSKKKRGKREYKLSLFTQNVAILSTVSNVILKNVHTSTLLEKWLLLPMHSGVSTI